MLFSIGSPETVFFQGSNTGAIRVDIRWLLLAGLVLVSGFVHAKVVDVVDSIQVNPTTILNYDSVTVTINWTAKGAVASGDTFSVTLPPQLQTVNTQTTMYSGASPVGTCDLVDSVITCTFNTTQVLGGQVVLTQQFYDATVINENQRVPTYYRVDGSAFATIDMTVSPRYRDPNEVLMKFGTPEQNGLSVGNRLEWYVRANCRQENIDNFLLSDVVGLPGHELDVTSIWIEEGACTGAGGAFVAESVIPHTDARVTVTPASAANGGEIRLRIPVTTDKAYIILYQTVITSIEDEYANTVTLTGDTGTISTETVRLTKEDMTATGYVGTAPVPVMGGAALLLLMLTLYARFGSGATTGRH